jgi:predicted XRE-type DNA-binding protein
MMMSFLAKARICSMVNREQIRVQLASAVIHMASRMTSSLLSTRLHIDPPKVAALRNGRLEIFSLERLMHLATQLSHDVEIVLRPHPRLTRLRRARVGVVRVVDLSDPEEVSII